MGAWVTYGLGSANRNLPSFVVLLDDKDPIGGPKQLERRVSAGDVYQGTQFRARRHADSRPEAAGGSE